MKEIKAFTHHRIAHVIRSLKESGQCKENACTRGCNLNVIAVQSLLKAVDSKEQHYSVELAQEIIHEYRLQLICEDDQVDELVEIFGCVASTVRQKPAGFTSATSLTIPIGGSRE